MNTASIRRQKRSTKPLPDPDAPRAQQYDSLAPELMREYLATEVDKRDLKIAGVWALVFHFFLFFIVIPTASVEPIPLRDQMATTIVKRYKPPAPPSRPKKGSKRKLAQFQFRTPLLTTPSR